MTPLRSTLALIGALCALALLSACNILGPVMYFAAGPPDVEARYEINDADTAVIFVDDRRSAVPTRSARRTIGVTAEREMLANEAVGDMIRTADVMAVVAREDYSTPLGIAEVGQAVGADVVVYATIDAFTISPDGQSLAPKGIMRVKIIRSEDSERLWPVDNKLGASVEVALARRTGPAPRDPAELARVERELAEAMGDQLARLFYTYSQDSSKTRVGETAYTGSN